jgi:uncharacterized protein (DUF362 family)
MNNLFDRNVYVVKTEPKYPSKAPFHPKNIFGGYLFDENYLDNGNNVYEAVRNLLIEIGKDKEGFSLDNILGWLIKPGDRVVIKPNLIKESHINKKNDWEYIITHGSVVRAVADFVLVALKGKGEVIIADSPQTDSDFDETVKRNGLREIGDFYNSYGFPVRLIDLREERWFGENGVIQRIEKLLGDPNGYIAIDLGKESAFRDYSKSGKFYGAYYDTKDTHKYHSQKDNRHIYILSKTCLDCDVFINLPKMKTHKKAGITLSMKNLVGICTHKNSLPHFTLGTPDINGDEYPTSSAKQKMLFLGARVFRRGILSLGDMYGVFRVVKKFIDSNLGDELKYTRGGNWYGNDTVWRMIVDLNRILFWFDGMGSNLISPRRYLTIVDGIVAGEGEGPMECQPKYVGLLFGGINPVAVDAVGARLMGFNPYKIPSIYGALKQGTFPIWDLQYDLGDIIVHSIGIEDFNGILRDIKHKGFEFLAPLGWRGHIEYE